MTLLSADQLRRVCPLAPALRLNRVAAALAPALAEFAIDTPRRLQHFLAQLAHESGSFAYLRELASGLAYEGREDLGNTEPGDGRRFKGWGWVQTTGRKNTCNVSLHLYGDTRLVDDPALIAPPSHELAARSAGYFWTIGAGLNLSQRAKKAGIPEGVNLNDLADRDAFELLTLAVNGGTNGIEDRRAYLMRARRAIA